jgi:hypothetical protein
METNIERMLVNLRKAKETSTRRTNPKTKVGKRKEIFQMAPLWWF